MAAQSIHNDESDREDAFDNAFCYVIDLPMVDDNELGKLLTEVDGQAWEYKKCGRLAIIEHFDELINDNIQPHKTTLEIVINANVQPNETVYSYLKSQLI
jgi:hypothetical protein